MQTRTQRRNRLLPVSCTPSHRAGRQFRGWNMPSLFIIHPPLWIAVEAATVHSTTRVHSPGSPSCRSVFGGGYRRLYDSEKRSEVQERTCRRLLYMQIQQRYYRERQATDHATLSVWLSDGQSAFSRVALASYRHSQDVHPAKTVRSPQARQGALIERQSSTTHLRRGRRM